MKLYISVFAFIFSVLFHFTIVPASVSAEEILCNINWIDCPPFGSCTPQDPTPTNETTMTQTAAEEFIEIYGLSTASCNGEYCSAIEYVSFLIDPSMDYAYLMKVYYNGDKAGIYEFEPYIGGGIMPLPSTWEVDCDPDDDGIENDIDNCPNVSNPNQYDVDNNTIGNVCDNNTIYGTISGDVQAGVSVNLNIYSCGLVDLESTTTNEDGYYAFGGLQNRSYAVVPENDNYTFDLTYEVIQMPQTVIQPHNFTASHSIVGTWGYSGITFYGDGSFEVESLSVQGTYEISGNQIRFIDDDCGTFEGFYTFSINENMLSFVYISDSCTERALTLLSRDHEKH